MDGDNDTQRESGSFEISNTGELRQSYSADYPLTEGGVSVPSDVLMITNPWASVASGFPTSTNQYENVNEASKFTKLKESQHFYLGASNSSGLKMDATSGESGGRVGEAVKLKGFDGKIRKEIVTFGALSDRTNASKLITTTGGASSTTTSPRGVRSPLAHDFIASVNADSQQSDTPSDSENIKAKSREASPLSSHEESPSLHQYQHQHPPQNHAARSDQYQHYSQGHSLRSDAYLRQALTSPYNQRSDRRNAFPESPRGGQGRDGNLACPSLWREGVRSHSSPRKDGGGGLDGGVHQHHHQHHLSSPGAGGVRHHGIPGGAYHHSSPGGGLTLHHVASSPGIGGFRYHSSPMREKGGGGAAFRQDYPGSGGRDVDGHPSAIPDYLSTFKTPKSTKSFRWKGHSPSHKGAGTLYSPASSASGGSSGSSSDRHHPFNPFESDHDRLHFPVFSPDMFNTVETPGRSESEKGFEWDAEHLAIIRPAHIDEKDILRQMSKTSPNEENNLMRQEAIDYFFRHHMVAPSPWGQPLPPHVLPTTPVYGQAYESIIVPTPQGARVPIKKGVDRSAQTTLTLPIDFDIQSKLREYMTYQEQEDGGRDSTGSSSLRRKLFLDGDSTSSLVSPVRSGDKSTDHEHDPDDHLMEPLRTPPYPSKTTPEWEGHCSPIHSPSSVQFSSSPIRGPLAHEELYHRTSFPDLGALASPELSPIAGKHSGRQRQRFLSGSSDLEMGKEGSGCQQIEIHDGGSAHSPLSPDVSPIAFHGSDSGRPSRSQTLKADLSVSLFAASPHDLVPADPSLRSPGLQPISPLTLPFAMYADGEGEDSPRRVRGNSVSMDTDGEFEVEKDKRCLSPRESSMAEIGGGDGEGLSGGCDTLHHPGFSSSSQDTGYQTGSGSLQTTQESGGVGVISGAGNTSSGNMTGVSGNNTSTVNTSAEVAVSDPDCSSHLKKMPPAFRSEAKEFAFAWRGGGGGSVTFEGKMVAPSVDSRAGIAEVDFGGSGDSEDAMGDGENKGGKGNIVHSNLTTQFMSLPFRSENPSDLDSSLRSLHSVSSSADLSPVDPLGTLFQGQWEARGQGQGEARGQGQGEASAQRSYGDGNDTNSQGFAPNFGRVSMDSSNSQGFGQCFGLSSDFRPSSNIGYCEQYDAERRSSRPTREKTSAPAVSSENVAQRSNISTVFSTAANDATLSGSLYDKDPAFLDKMADYLQRGEDTASEGSGKNGADNPPTTPLTSTHGGDNPLTPPTSKQFESQKGLFDDSVLVRAKQYLASVRQTEEDAKQFFAQGREISGGFELHGNASPSSDERGSGGEEGLRKVLNQPPLLVPVRASTPTKRSRMGKVAEDLVSSARRSQDGPALASERATEIMRRAKQELRQIGRSGRQRSEKS